MVDSQKKSKGVNGLSDLEEMVQFEKELRDEAKKAKKVVEEIQGQRQEMAERSKETRLIEVKI